MTKESIFPSRWNCTSVALNENEILIYGGACRKDSELIINTQGIFTFNQKSKTVTVQQKDAKFGKAFHGYA